MKDKPLDELGSLSPQELLVLQDFARNIIAARTIMKWVAWIGGVAMFFAALFYYLFSIWATLHGAGAENMHGTR